MTVTATVRVVRVLSSLRSGHYDGGWRKGLYVGGASGMTFIKARALIPWDKNNSSEGLHPRKEKETEVVHI